MTCPDCHGELAIDATKCRCGWKASAAIAAVKDGVVRVMCDAPGCGDWAFIRVGKKRNLCRRCWEGQLNEQAFANCKDRGLNTVADMRAYCSRLMRSGVFSQPSFEKWASRMTQGTVDRMALMGGKSDEQVLRRLRALGVIDDANKLIPMDKRAAVRAAHDAKIEAERRRAAEILQAQGVVRADGGLTHEESSPT